MSWIEKNYEKAALGGAVVAALGLAYFGWSKLASVDTDFIATHKGPGKPAIAVQDAELVTKAMASMKLPRIWDQALDGDRPVDLFTGIPLFVGSAAPEEPIDLPTGAPVHPPIPNNWWLNNHIDPGYGDSPARDPDSDGFSNLEEFQAKTDPNDVKSYPALIAKLRYEKDESMFWVLIPRYGDGKGKYPFLYEDSKGAKNKTSNDQMMGPGDIFFGTGAMANRFKMLGTETRKEFQTSINQELDVTYARIEDQRPNKKGTIYEFPAPLQDLRKNQYLKYDRTAIFTLQALGKGSTEYKVEENTLFALPLDGAKKTYLLKQVTPESVTVEYSTPEGEKKSVVIKKGSFPEMTE